MTPLEPSTPDCIVEIPTAVWGTPFADARPHSSGCGATRPTLSAPCTTYDDMCGVVTVTYKEIAIAPDNHSHSHNHRYTRTVTDTCTRRRNG